MSGILVNAFTQYTLSQEEQLQSFIFNAVQLQGLQNELASVSLQLISLQFDPEKPIAFAQEQAYLRGQQELLQTLMERSKQTEELLVKLAQQSGS